MSTRSRSRAVTPATRRLPPRRMPCARAASSDTSSWRGSRPGDPDLVATGASGFGIMALIVGTERGFIPREQSTARMRQIVGFLETADRFHGAWPHFMSGRTGHVIPLFGRYDDGGDLVETAFLTQGLLAARQYFKADQALYDRITALWEGVEWSWHRKTPDGA